jgi:hypothetical protein
VLKEGSKWRARIGRSSGDIPLRVGGERIQGRGADARVLD